ncbi:hypothetical protein C0991_002700, partial [Blastosporella zonata]
MVDPEWLARPENEKYDTETRIIESGKAWGDEHDPEDLAKKREVVKSMKKEIAEGKKRKIVEGDMEGGKAKKNKKGK